MILSNDNLPDFLTKYFSLHDCKVTYESEGVLNVQLTEAMDKALMNRPFYWHYVNSTGQQGQPMNVTFVTNANKKDVSGEWIHFGSPRLQQMIAHLKDHSKYTCLFQQVDTSVQTPLFPWLVVNIKIKYTGKLTKEEFFSIGLNLVNGLMKVNMMDKIKTVPFKLHIMDYCYPMSPMIKIPSGFKRIEGVLEKYIENQTHEWATNSLNELHNEKQLIQYFFKNKQDHDQYVKEIEEVTLRYTPTITYKVVNGGLFYLHQNFNEKAE